MSRIANKPLLIPSGITVNIQENVFAFKGPKGTNSFLANVFLDVSHDNNKIVIKLKNSLADGATIREKNIDKKFRASLIGSACANIKNILHGVTVGFEKKLVLVGVGYRAQLQGNVLNLSLGFSHPVTFKIPVGITIETPSPTEIIIKGCDKQLVGQVAADIRDIRKVEPYKGKGIRYSTELVILKETKK